MAIIRLRLMLGRRLRAARISIGYGLREFAEDLGISYKEYDQIENGHAEPDLATLIYAARITDKSLDFLLTGDGPRKD